jgi:transmembrane sensor
LAFYFNKQTSIFEGVKYTELYIPYGEDARIFFQDGTEVYLNSGTRIRYPERFGIRQREIFLDDEAYFNVTTNSKRPFIVNAQNTSVRVLGTSFNVNAYSESEFIKVVLDEGKTSFHVQGSSYSMTPGQLLEYNKITGRTILSNLSKPSSASLWKDNMIYFYDTPLAEVLKVLERKYDVKFHLQATGALEYSYTITTKHTDLEAILAELQKIAPVRFDQKEKNIFVTL